MKRSIGAFLLLLVLGLGTAFVATSMFSTYAGAEGDQNVAASSSDK
jgi:hypothetical protein